MNKYYIPELSDLYVGYECELINIHSDSVDSYRPHTLHINSSPVQWKEWIYFEALRTPYLTKEQIEAEGWFYVDVPPHHKEDDGGIKFLGKKFLGSTPTQDNGIIIRFYPQYDHSIYIVRVWGKDGKDSDEVLFSGRCPSINEFRKIMKWLEIS